MYNMPTLELQSLQVYTLCINDANSVGYIDIHIKPIHVVQVL